MHLRTPLVSLLLASALLAQLPYGSGSAGAGGFVPTIRCPQAWMGNAGFGFSVSGGPGGGAGLLAVSTEPASSVVGGVEILVGIGSEELLLVTPFSLAGPSGVAGAGVGLIPFPLAFPATPLLAGRVFRVQAVVDDPVAGGLAATAGLAVEVTLPRRLYVGAVAGAAFEHHLLDPETLGPAAPPLPTAGYPTGAVFANGGRDLFVAEMNDGVWHADLAGSQPIWTQVWFVPGVGSNGAGYDEATDRLFTVASLGANPQELVVLDGRPGSPAFAQVLGTTQGGVSGLGTPGVWALSRSGRLAAVCGNGPSVALVDCDPGSSGYLGAVGPLTIPSASTAGAPVAVAVTPDDAYVLVALNPAATFAELAVYDVAAAAWVDRDPGTPGVQNLGPAAQPPAVFGARLRGLDIARDGSFVALTASAVTAGLPDAFGRIDLTGGPASWNWLPIVTSVPLLNTSRLVLSRDGREAFVRHHSLGVTAPQDVVALDAETGASLGAVSIELPSFEIYAHN